MLVSSLTKAYCVFCDCPRQSVAIATFYLLFLYFRVGVFSTLRRWVKVTIITAKPKLMQLKFDPPMVGQSNRL